MKSIEKRMILLLIVSTVSAVSMWSMSPLEDPKTIKEVLPLILWIWGIGASGVGIFVSTIVLAVRGVIRLRRKYRDHCVAFREGLPVKFPTFFKFMKWLNTDD